MVTESSSLGVGFPLILLLVAAAVFALAYSRTGTAPTSGLSDEAVPPVPARVGLPALVAAFGLPSSAWLRRGRSRPASRRPTQPGPSSSAYERIKDAGANLTRVIIDWAIVAPKERARIVGSDRPRRPQLRLVRVSTSRSGTRPTPALRVLASIYQAHRRGQNGARPTSPGSATPTRTCSPTSPRPLPSATTAPDPQPRVQYWKAWNEPNLFLFFLPQFKGRQEGLADALQDDAEQVRDPGPGRQSDQPRGRRRPGAAPAAGRARSARLHAQAALPQGSLEPEADPGLRREGEVRHLGQQPLYDRRARPTSQPDPMTYRWATCPKVKKVIRAASRYNKVSSKPKKPALWVTEFSWDSNRPDPGAAPMSTLKKWVPEALYGAWKAGVSKFFWLSLRDWERAPGLPYSETIESGLYFRGETLAADKPKPILRAFRFPFVAYRKKLRPEGLGSHAGQQLGPGRDPLPAERWLAQDQDPALGRQRRLQRLDQDAQGQGRQGPASRPKSRADRRRPSGRRSRYRSS